LGTAITSFYGYDGHGSVRQLFDSTGAVTDSYDYDAFGNLINSTGTTPNNYLFAGEAYDSALGLYYNRARYLNTATGRFWSMDTHEGKERDPLSLHKYLYAEGNPVDHVDPSGHEIDMVEVLAVAAIVVTLSSMAVTPVTSEARVEVHFDEIKAARSAHHAYLLLKAANRPTLVFRGGPSGGQGCGLSDVFYGESGSDTSSDCGYLTSAGSNAAFVPGAADYPKDPGDDVAKANVLTLRDSSYNGLQSAFNSAANKIDRMHLPYDPVVQNSNAFAYTLLLWGSLPPPQPPVWTPGWGNALLDVP
jgi:RHS repeat-associated protein